MNYRSSSNFRLCNVILSSYLSTIYFHVLEVPSNYSIGATYKATDDYISSIITNTTTSSNFQTTSKDPNVVPNTGISITSTQRSQTTMIETTIKPEATVETTEIGMSKPETTTIQRETLMLPACVCTCIIATHICPVLH